MTRIKVLIVDDHIIARNGLKSLIKRIACIAEIAEAENGKQALEEMKNGAAQLVFLDISMPEMNGFDTLTELKKNYPETKVVLLSMYSPAKYIQEALTKGADGYLLKGVDGNELKRAVMNVMGGDSYFSPGIQSIIAKILTDKENFGEEAVELTDREREVLTLICEQYSSVEIAEKLNVSDKTVNRHRQNLLEKTKSKNSAGLVMFAIRHNLIHIKSEDAPL